MSKNRFKINSLYPYCSLNFMASVLTLQVCLSEYIFFFLDRVERYDIYLYICMALYSCSCSCSILKKGKRKVQGVPQSQIAALPRPQEEEETDKSKQAQTEQTYEKH